MHSQNMSFWRKALLVISLPFVLLILLPYAMFHERWKTWRINRKGRRK